jgi:hypothetical protein
MAERVKPLLERPERPVDGRDADQAAGPEASPAATPGRRMPARTRPNTAFCLILVHDELLVLDIIAERTGPPIRMPFFFEAVISVAHALTRDLPLELGEREQNVQREPSHRGRCVELLRDGHERDAVLVEELTSFAKSISGPACSAAKIQAAYPKSGFEMGALGQEHFTAQIHRSFQICANGSRLGKRFRLITYPAVVGHVGKPAEYAKSARIQRPKWAYAQFATAMSEADRNA